MNIKDKLDVILDAKEKRAALKNGFAQQGLNSLTLSLNIPGVPKSNEQINAFFTETLAGLKTHLNANRIKLLYAKESFFTDGAGDFFIAPFAANDAKELLTIKNVCENFEKSHVLGRLIDVDIYSHEKKHISSGIHKLCYFCGEHPAIYCMRNKSHPYTLMRKKIFSDIESYLAGQKTSAFLTKITILATRAILYEISLSPKPGLVDFYSPGTHDDMNFYSFLNSSAVLSGYFKEFCEAGMNFSFKQDDALPIIRKIGLKAEIAMFGATNDVNTQKGLIFLFGIALFAYAYLFANKKELSNKNFRQVIMKIGKNLIKNELLDNDGVNLTHGEKVYQLYSEAGIRQEVENGFSVVFNTAVPYFGKQLNGSTYLNKKKINRKLRIGMLKIMAVNNDTNILYRSNIDTLDRLKNRAKKSIKNKGAYKKLCKFCKTSNLSPGGSADLLALSLFIHFVNVEL